MEATVEIRTIQRTVTNAEVTVEFIVHQEPDRPPEQFARIFSVAVTPHMTDREIGLVATEEAKSFLEQKYPRA